MKKLYTIIIFTITILGVVIGIYASINPQGVFQIFARIGFGNIMVILPIIVIILIAISLFMNFGGLLGKSKIKKRLMQTGQRTTAKILNVQDTGMTVNMNPYVNITVETTSGNQATFKMMVPRIQIPRPGDTMEILFDPADPTVAVPAN
jgi:ABC-type dipeptide/oligopeptide/nickel transport system permease component